LLSLISKYEVCSAMRVSVILGISLLKWRAEV
jgi:hypothetical protein